jgi:transposase
MPNNDLVAKLATLDQRSAGKQEHLIQRLFADSPEILEAIRQARGRGATFTAIAKLVGEHTGVRISEKAVANWFRSIS